VLFEDGTTAWSTGGFQDNTQLTVLEKQGLYNLNAMKVERIDGSGTGTGATISQHKDNWANPFTLTQGEKMTVSWYVKGVGNTIGKNVRAHCYATDGTNTISTGTIYTLTSEWQRITHTLEWTYDTEATTLAGYARVEGIEIGDYFLVCMPQMEKKRFATSFVDGSRQEGRLVVHQSGLELIHFWAKFKGIGTGNFVFCTVYSYDVSGNKLWIDPDGYLNYRQGSSDITTSIQIQEDVWYMFVWDLKNNRLFVGNASDSDDIHFINHSTNITVNGDEVTLGCNSGGSFGYSVVGSTLLANVVFGYNADYWTDSYIQEVYNARAPFAK